MSYDPILTYPDDWEKFTSTLDLAAMTLLGPGRSEQVDETVLENATAEATEIIYGRLSGVYDVPFTTPPARIKGLCRELVKLICMRYQNKPKAQEAITAFLKAELDPIVEGAEALDGAAGVGGSATSGEVTLYAMHGLEEDEDEDA